MATQNQLVKKFVKGLRNAITQNLSNTAAVD